MFCFFQILGNQYVYGRTTGSKLSQNDCIQLIVEHVNDGLSDDDAFMAEDIPEMQPPVTYARYYRGKDSEFPDDELIALADALAAPVDADDDSQWVYLRRYREDIIPSEDLLEDEPTVAEQIRRSGWLVVPSYKAHWESLISYRRSIRILRKAKADIIKYEEKLSKLTTPMRTHEMCATCELRDPNNTSEGDDCVTCRLFGGKPNDAE